MPRNRPQPAKALIVARGERIKDVAAALGLGDHSLYSVLNGLAAPWPALTDRLADHLGCDAADLWHDDRTIADAARRLVESTRRAQGLPATVDDVAVLDKVAALISGGGAPNEAA